MKFREENLVGKTNQKILLGNGSEIEVYFNGSSLLINSGGTQRLTLGNNCNIGNTTNYISVGLSLNRLDGAAGGQNVFTFTSSAQRLGISGDTYILLTPGSNYIDLYSGSTLIQRVQSDGVDISKHVAIGADATIDYGAGPTYGILCLKKEIGSYDGMYGDFIEIENTKSGIYNTYGSYINAKVSGSVANIVNGIECR